MITPGLLVQSDAALQPSLVLLYSAHIVLSLDILRIENRAPAKDLLQAYSTTHLKQYGRIHVFSGPSHISAYLLIRPYQVSHKHTSHLQMLRYLRLPAKLDQTDNSQFCQPMGYIFLSSLLPLFKN